MSNFSNPAKRVLNCVEKAVGAPKNESTAEVWAGVLGLDKKEATRDPHNVVGKLGLLRGQVDLVQEYMSKTKFSANLYSSHLHKIKSTITVQSISAAWNNYSQHLSAETMLALRFCAEIIEDEPEVSFDDLQSLLNKVTELRDELESGSLRGTTYEFIKSQLKIIEEAIRNYPLEGGKAIKQAFESGFSDLTERADDLNGSEDVESTNKLKKIWKDFKSAGEEFVAADKIANAYGKLIEKAQTFSESVSGLPFFNG